MPQAKALRRLLVLPLVSLLACRSSLPEPPKTQRFAFQQEAGSTHIAVLSVGPWGDYVEKLQPDFTLTEAQALSRVNEVSQAADRTFIDALSLGLKIQPGKTSTTETSSTETKDGKTTRSSMRTDEREPGDVSDLETSDNLASRAITPTPPSSGPALGGLNPMLQHLTATALYQEVQLLDSYVKDAVRRTGYKPYVVRTQISVLPSAHNEPYDAYTTLSFFPNQPPLASSVPLIDGIEPNLIRRLRTPPPSSIEQQREAFNQNVEDLARVLEGFADSQQLEKKEQLEVASQLGIFRNKDLALEERLRAADETLNTIKLDPNASLSQEVAGLSEAPYSKLSSWQQQYVEDCTSAKSEVLGYFENHSELQSLSEAANEIGEEVTLSRDAVACERLGRILPLKDSTRNPIVVPILVTDNLESSSVTQTTDELRQYALSLAFLLQNTAGQAEFNRFTRNLEKIFGRDLNSLLTVARVTDNSYRVRLGAVQQVGTRFSTLPRTHNVTFLLLVPCDHVTSESNLIDVVSQTEWRDAEEGHALQERGNRAISFRLSGIAKRYKPYGLGKCTASKSSGADSITVLRELARLAQTNQWPEFLHKLEDSCFSTNPGQKEQFPSAALWTDLAELMIENRYASTSFELPRFQRPELPDLDSQYITLLDDGMKGATMSVVGGRFLRAHQVEASLRIYTSSTGRLVIPAESTKVAREGTGLQLTFPSLKAWGVSGNEPKALYLVCRNCLFDPDCQICPRGSNSPEPLSVVASVPNPLPGSSSSLFANRSVGGTAFLSLSGESSVCLPSDQPQSADEKVLKERECSLEKDRRVIERLGPTCSDPDQRLARISYLSKPSDTNPKEDKPSPRFNLIVRSKNVVPDANHLGRLEILFEFDKEKVPDAVAGREVKKLACREIRLSLEGADLAASPTLGSGIDAVDQDFLIFSVAEDTGAAVADADSARRKIVLALSNLSPKVPVKLFGTCTKAREKAKEGGKTKEIELQVSITPSRAVGESSASADSRPGQR